MNRLTRIFCTIILVFASVLFAADEIRKLGVEDLLFGQSTTTSTGGVVSTQINASKIPMSSGSDNVEATIQSLQTQITDLETALTALTDNVALKANLASPTFTGTVTVTGAVTASGEVTAQQFASSGGDGTHYAQIANTTAPAVPATDNAGIMYFKTGDSKLYITNSTGVFGYVTVTYE